MKLFAFSLVLMGTSFLSCQEPPNFCRATSDCTAGTVCQTGVCIAVTHVCPDAGTSEEPVADAGTVSEPPDTREWVWKKMETPTSPEYESEMGMVYDAAASATMVIGSIGSNARELESWQWNGNQWTRILPSASPPFPRSGFSIVFDHENQLALLYGGYRNSNFMTDTWIWKSGTWAELTLTDNPGGRVGYAMAFDKARKETIVFGGNNSASEGISTWAFDGTAWKKETPTRVPTARSGHAMAYDEARQQIVLFGGKQNSNARRLNDTWLWNGQDWRLAELPENAPAPSARENHTLTYNSRKQRIVLFGGYDNSLSELDDTWEWDGEKWTEMPPQSLRPEARRSHHMVYDEKQHELLLFGGYGGASTLSDTWKMTPP